MRMKFERSCAHGLDAKSWIDILGVALVFVVLAFVLALIAWWTTSVIRGTCAIFALCMLMMSLSACVESVQRYLHERYVCSLKRIQSLDLR
jgi:hypothetical protein